MAMLDFIRARRKSQESAFDIAEQEYNKLRAEKKQIVSPSFHGGKEDKQNIQRMLREKKEEARRNYMSSFAENNPNKQKQFYEQYKSAKTQENRFIKAKAEQRKERLEPFVKTFNLISKVSKASMGKIRKRAAPGIYHSPFK